MLAYKEYIFVYTSTIYFSFYKRNIYVFKNFIHIPSLYKYTTSKYIHTSKIFQSSYRQVKNSCTMRYKKSMSEHKIQN